MISTTTKNAVKYKALPTNNQNKSSRPLKQFIFISFSVCVVFMLIIIFNDEQVEDIDMNGTTKGIIHLGVTEANIKDMNDIIKYKKDLEMSLVNLTDKVTYEYGDYLQPFLFQNMTNELPEFFSKLYQPSSKAQERLMRRYQIKFLKSNLYREVSTFTWQTAGHSASAGHGNIFNQSYTALIEDTVKESFAALNIDFRGYNFGMGGMSSAPELSLCEEAVYGPDIDILNWDFGMTDGRKTHGINLFAHRAALHPTRPILFGFIGGSGARRGAFFNMENQANLSSIMFDSDAQLVNTFPDSDKLDIDTLPLALKYYVCSGKVENGNCAPAKYDTQRFCNQKVKGQVGWHPGWKDHMLKGRLIGLYLLHVLYRSINDLIQNTQTDLQSHLQTLIDQENKEKEYYQQHLTHFLTNYTDESPLSMPIFERLENRNDINLIMHFRNTICRTALLPSHTRYNDIVFNHLPSTDSSSEFLFTQGLTNSEYQERQNPLEHSNSGHDPYKERQVGQYYTLTNTPLHYSEKINTTLSIIHQENDNSRITCKDAQLDIDYKDTFFIGKNDKDTPLQIPNEAELHYYNHGNGNVTKCAIMFVLYTCPWRRCPKDYITIDSLLDQKNTKVRFILNNDTILTSVVMITNNAFMLLNDDGSAEFDYDGSKPFTLSFDVAEDGLYFYMTSIVFFQW